jgi:hypothetical protein
LESTRGPELTNLFSDDATFANRGEGSMSVIESDADEHTLKDVEDELEGDSESELNYEDSAESDLDQGDSEIQAGGLASEVEGDLDIEEQSEGSKLHGMPVMESVNENLNSVSS